MDQAIPALALLLADSIHRESSRRSSEWHLPQSALFSRSRSISSEQSVADLRMVDEEIRPADKLRNNLQQYIAVMPIAQLVLKQLQGFDPAFDRGIAQIRQQLCPVT